MFRVEHKLCKYIVLIYKTKSMLHFQSYDKRCRLDQKWKAVWSRKFNKLHSEFHAIKKYVNIFHSIKHNKWNVEIKSGEIDE